MKTIGVHNGKFHADDLFAAAILKTIFPSVEIVRTRDAELLKTFDARIDVGGNYNHATKDYDHHQAEFKEVRANGIPYASAGLIWKHYGDTLVSSKEVWERIDEKLIQFIDADDIGLLVYEKKLLEPYTLRNVIFAFEPVSPHDQSSNAYDLAFHSALELSLMLLQKEIILAENLVQAKKKIISLAQNKEYIVLEESLPWKEIAITDTQLKFVIKEDRVNKTWAALAVPVALGSFKNRKDFPRAWGGLMGESLARVSGVPDAVFCHRNLFNAAAKTKEGAIALVERALKDESD